MTNMKLFLTVMLCLSFSLLAEENPECPQFEPGTLCSSVEPFCGDDCDNTPFCPTTCWTSSSGPAWGGGGEGSTTNQLYCEKATYANCHFSGPPYPTGTNQDNIPLPCRLSDDNRSASCKCEVFTGPTIVNLTGIMNLGVYYETIAVCGEDGSKCQNMSNCPADGNNTCSGTVAPVCKYVLEQNPDDPSTSLIPGADLISTFGFEMQDDYPMGSTSCENLLVAGCMSAPCTYENGEISGSKYATCECLTSFQESFSLSQDNQQCDIGPDYVWE